MNDKEELSNLLSEWREKLSFFMRLEPTTVDPEQKFNLDKKIKEYKNKINELENKIKIYEPLENNDRTVIHNYDEEKIIPINKNEPIIQDYPSTNEHFVGREGELKKLNNPSIRVAAITGLGGEGKSSLATKFFDLAFTHSTIIKYDKLGWCNFKETENPFHDKLKSLLTYMTDETESIQRYSEESFNQTVYRFIQLLNQYNCLVVFDNMDKFADKQESAFTSSLGIFFDMLVKNLNKSLVIFTCRIPIEDANPTFIEIPIEGLDFEEVKKLANVQQMLDIINEETLKVLYDGTNGHALWLNLIFGQLKSNRISAENAKELVKEPLESLNRVLLSSIWNNLNDDEKEIIYVISGFTRPHDIFKIEKITKFNQRKCIGIIKSLIRLHLITEIDAYGRTYYDLHPIIKVKAKSICNPEKKIDIYNSVVSILSRGGRWNDLLTIIKINENYTPDLDGFVECAELAIENEEMIEAMEYIYNLTDPLLILGELTKFINLVKEFLKSIDYNEEKFFDSKKMNYIFQEFIECLLNIGEFSRVEKEIKDYQNRIKVFNHYTHYVKMQGFFLWRQEKFQEAIDFLEKEIIKIKENNEEVDDEIYNTLNLSKRDIGRADEALHYYLKKEIIEKIETWEPEINDEISATDLGNIGRCYYILEKYDISLKLCLASYDALKKEKSLHSRTNQGYALIWLTDIYIKVENLEEAYKCFQKALEVWKRYCPSRLSKIQNHYDKYPSSFKKKFGILKLGV